MDKEGEVVKILAGLVMDIVTPIRVLREYEALPEFHCKNEEYFRQGVYRLCLSAVIVAMAKYVELWRKYSAVKRLQLSEHDKVINKYMEKIKKTGAISFRNDYLVHVQDDKEKRILTGEEIDSHIERITGDNAENLFSWVYPIDYSGVREEESLVGVIMLSKEALRLKRV